MTAPDPDDLQVDIIDGRDAAFIVVAHLDGHVRINSHVSHADLIGGLRRILADLESRNTGKAGGQ